MKVSPDIIGLDNTRLDMKMDQETIPSLYFFNILKKGLKYIGVYMEKWIAHKIYCVVISVLVWINFARFISIFFTMKDTSDRMMGIGAVASFLIVIPLNSTANMYALTKYLDNIFRLIGDYTEHYGIHSNIIKIRKRCPALLAIMVIFGVCIFIAITLFTILFPISEESLLMNSYTPAQNWSIYMFSIAVFVINYLAFHGGLQLMLLTFFYCLVCYFIGSEYRIISTDLFNLVEDGNFEDHQSKIEIIRQQHEAVTRILDSSNCVLQNIVLFTYAGAIPLICFVIYGLIKGGLPSEDMAAFSQIICLTITLVIIVTTAGSLINTMAHAPISSLHRMDLDGLPAKTLQQINIFAVRLSGPPIGIDVYGLFVVDKSTVLMLFGTILTYAIVVLQIPSTINGGTSTECNCTVT